MSISVEKEEPFERNSAVENAHVCPQFDQDTKVSSARQNKSTRGAKFTQQGCSFYALARAGRACCVTAETTCI